MATGPEVGVFGERFVVARECATVSHYMRGMLDEHGTRVMVVLPPMLRLGNGEGVRVP